MIIRRFRTSNRQGEMKSYLKSFNVLSDEEIGILLQSASTKVIDKYEYFIREGEVCKEVAFIKSGIFRSFYISGKGEEITYCINFPGNMMTAYSSFITKQSTPENIQAICPAELLTVPVGLIDQWSAKGSSWSHFLRIMAEQQYIELEKRVFQLQRDNAIQRYSSLLKDHPEYIKNIPLQYLASYLGISQRHLSRIRKTF